MAKRYMRRCSTSFIREMQIKTHNEAPLHTCQKGYYQKDNKWQRGCGNKGTIVQCWCDHEFVYPLRERSEAPSEFKGRTAIWFSNSKNVGLRRYVHHTFIVDYLQWSRYGSNTGVTDRWMSKEDMVCVYIHIHAWIYTHIYHIHIYIHTHTVEY